MPLIAMRCIPALAIPSHANPTPATRCCHSVAGPRGAAHCGPLPSCRCIAVPFAGLRCRSGPVPDCALQPNALMPLHRYAWRRLPSLRVPAGPFLFNPPLSLPVPHLAAAAMQLCAFRCLPLPSGRCLPHRYDALRSVALLPVPSGATPCGAMRCYALLCCRSSAALPFPLRCNALLPMPASAKPSIPTRYCRCAPPRC